MNIRPDTIMHLKGSALLALLLVGVVFIAVHFGPGYAVAAGAVALAGGVEWYQAVRSEGTPSIGDAVASAAVGLGIGLCWQLGVALGLLS